MNFTPINFSEKLNLFSDQWSPRIIGQMNDYHFKVAKVQGEFVWHNHPETDETFIVLKGELVILFKDGDVRLKEGEMYIVPRGVIHKPIADEECAILLIEPVGTLNTGDAGGEYTIEENEWI